MADTTPVGRRHRSVLLPLSSERARRPFRSPFRSPDGAAVAVATTNTTTPPPPAASRRPPAKQLLLHQPSTPPPAAAATAAGGGGGCSTPVNRNRSCRLSAGTTGAPSIAAVAPQLPPGQKHSLPVMAGDGGVIGPHTPLSSGAENYRTPAATVTVTTTTTTTTKTVSTVMSLSKSAAVGDGSRGGDCSLEQQQWAPVGGTCDGDRAKTTAAVFRPPTALSTPSAAGRSGGGGGGVCGGGGDRVAVVVAALDAEIGELEAEGCCVNQLLLYRTALHRYNVVKDAAQVVMGRLAELDGVTVRAVHERFDTLPSTELL